jgi:hypothetical protein
VAIVFSGVTLNEKWGEFEHRHQVRATVNRMAVQGESAVFLKIIIILYFNCLFCVCTGVNTAGNELLLSFCFICQPKMPRKYIPRIASFRTRTQTSQQSQ